MTVRARVKNGRLVVDEPTDLPDGTEIDLTSVGDDDERRRLDAALETSAQQFREGKGIPADEVVARLRRR